MAIPRSAQRSTVWFAATRMLRKSKRKTHIKRCASQSLTCWQRPTHDAIVSYRSMDGVQTLTMQPAAVKPNKMAFIAKIMVAKNLGFLYTASRYTFSPPERGNMVPNSSQIKSPQKERKKPRTQSMREAPTDWTEDSIDDGVEKIPVPIIRPTLGIERQWAWRLI